MQGIFLNFGVVSSRSPSFKGAPCRHDVYREHLRGCPRRRWQVRFLKTVSYCRIPAKLLEVRLRESLHVGVVRLNPVIGRFICCNRALSSPPRHETAPSLAGRNGFGFMRYCRRLPLVRLGLTSFRLRVDIRK
jgi:hypothetical protein